MLKVSVIVPVYNVEKYLNRCIDSILSQTFTDYEIILVDDGSPDNCGKICDEYALKDSRIKVIHKQNGGLSSARNAGLDWAMENSDSEWISFIDSDDYVSTNYLSVLYDACVKNNVDVSICDYVCVDEDGKNLDGETNALTNEVLGSKEAFRLSLSNSRFVIAWNKLYRKNIFQELRFPVGKVHEDLFTYYKILLNVNKIATVGKVCYYYVQREGSIVNVERCSRNINMELDSFEALLNRHHYAKERGIVWDNEHIDACFWHIIDLIREIKDKSAFNRLEKLKKLYRPFFFQKKCNRGLKKKLWFNHIKLYNFITRNRNLY